MKAVLALVALAILLTLVGGVGFIAARILEAPAVWQFFGWVLYGALAVTFAALSVALLVGLWHLYLYFFTDKRPLSLFATAKKDDE